MLSRPPWVDFGDGDLRVLTFLWDDARVFDDFTGDATRVLDAAPEMSIRARLALLVGLYEWILWRFDGLYQRAEPEQILEAAWCATVDPRYLKFFELTREEWVGPVEGPLWCAFTYLEHGFRQANAFEADTYTALEFNYLLAHHVIPDARPFEHWVDRVLARFVERYPVGASETFEDLFEERIGEHLGPYVGRDALDPARPPDMARDRAFLLEVLQETRSVENPFLADEDDLDDLRFAGPPYVLRPLPDENGPT